MSCHFLHILHFHYTHACLSVSRHCHYTEGEGLLFTTALYTATALGHTVNGEAAPPQAFERERSSEPPQQPQSR